MSEKNISKTQNLASKVIFAAFTVLKENGGEMPGKEVINLVGKRVSLDDWDLEKYEKTGYIRWVFNFTLLLHRLREGWIPC